MANDRLYIRCVGCNEYIMLAKDFIFDIEISRSPNELSTWMTKHRICHEFTDEMLSLDKIFTFENEDSIVELEKQDAPDLRWNDIKNQKIY